MLVRYALDPDWEVGPAPRRPFVGLPLLWAGGLLGAYLLSILSLPIAERAGFRSILGEQLDELTVVDQLMFVVVAAPLLEETIYRLALARQLRLPVLTVAGLLAGTLFWGSHPLAMGVGPAIGLTALAAWAHRPTGSAVTRWWADNPRWPVWASVLLFGMSHLVGFDVDVSPLVVLAPLAVLPQIWLGLVFTVARVRFGFWAAIVVHALHNLSVWSLATAIS